MSATSDAWAKIVHAVNFYRPDLDDQVVLIHQALLNHEQAQLAQADLVATGAANEAQALDRLRRDVLKVWQGAERVSAIRDVAQLQTALLELAQRRKESAVLLDECRRLREELTAFRALAPSPEKLT